MKKQLLFGLVLISFSLAAQSPWTRSKAGFFVQASWHMIPSYSEVFESKTNPNRPLDRELQENTFQLYGEYGLDDKTTLLASLPLRYMQSGDLIPAGTPAAETQRGYLFGLGNASLGVKRSLLDGRLRLSGSFLLDFPSSIYDDRTGLRAGFNTWTFQPAISTGMGLGNFYWYAHANYALRTNRFSDFVNAGAELGFKIGKCRFAGFSEFVYSLENGVVLLPLNNRITHLYADRQGWWSLGVKGIVEVNRFWGFTASFAGAAWAQFVPKSPGIGLGVYVKWD